MDLTRTGYRPNPETIQALKSLMAQKGGGARALLVTGEAGTGKTALALPFTHKYYPSSFSLRAKPSQSASSRAYPCHIIWWPGGGSLARPICPPRRATRRTASPMSAGPVSRFF